MTGQNPLFALLAGMGQNGQQNPQAQSGGPSLPVPPAMGAGPSGPPPALASFLQSPTQNPSLPKLNPTTVTAPQSSVSPLAESTLLGFLNQNSQMGEIPDSTTFNKQFRQSTSPAREILADMFLGMSSSLTGEKFRDLKQRKYEEFQTDLANKMEQLKQQRLMQQAQATQAGDIYRQMQEQQLSSDEANAKSEQGANEFNLKYGVDYLKYQQAQQEAVLNAQKAQETARHNATTEAQATIPKSSTYEQALNETLANYQAKGLDPTKDPRIKPKFLTDVSARNQQLQRFESGLKQQELPPLPLQYVTQSTLSGRSYINSGEFTGKRKEQITEAALAKGIPVIPQATADILSDGDIARKNLNYMYQTINSKLASDPQGRLYKAPENTIAKLSQSDPDLAAIGTYRNAAIQAMRAVAGSKGLRINQAEIHMAIENDLPQPTDTLPTAQARLKNLTTFLDNIEDVHLTRNRAGGDGPVTMKFPNGRTAKVPSKDVDAAKQAGGIQQ